MGLFSMLPQDAPHGANSSNHSSNHSSSRSAALPTVVQLYTEQPVGVTTGAAATTSSLPPYALLTYQALATADLAVAREQTSTTGPSLRKTTQPAQDAAPDLGVWNCRIVLSPLLAATSTTSSPSPKTTTSSEALLAQVMKQHAADDTTTTGPCYCVTVDLSKPALVEPTLTALQNALVRHLVASHDDYRASSPEAPVATATQTTSVALLRATQFGLASQDTSYTAPATPADDTQSKIALMICATIAPAAEDDYAQQQGRALLLYHLRKYAVALQATLVFCRREEAATADMPCQPPVAASAASLAVLWRAWAQGTPIWEAPAALLEETGLLSPSSEDDSHALVYGPDHYQQELVETVLLRAAQYPGHWDAATDSLWKIWPAAANHRPALPPCAASAGDESWLAELRASMDTATTGGSPFTSPEPKKKRETPQKTPNEASAFFESLLK
jgi:hypothetical protein